MDDELEHSPWSWLDDFMQRFSWCRPSARASPFLNNYFLPGVHSFKNLQTFFVVGPAIGYMAGGAFLNIYTDVDSGIEIKDLNSNSPLWVGAWWIGFMVAVFMSWSCALFISKYLHKVWNFYPQAGNFFLLDLN